MFGIKVNILSLFTKIEKNDNYICKVKTECPMSGNSLKGLVVYQATISTEDHNPAQTYVELMENSKKLNIQIINPGFLMPIQGKILS